MSGESIEVSSEARGSHWVAWVTRAGESALAAPILMVGQTREEAEARMKSWWQDYEAGPHRRA